MKSPRLLLAASFALIVPLGLVACGDDDTIDTSGAKTQVNDTANNARSAVAGVGASVTEVTGNVKGSATAVAGDATFTVNLKAVQNSGVTGEAKFTPDNDKTKVEIKLSGGDPNATYSAGLYEGTCDSPDDTAKYPLQDVNGGQSSSTVNEDVGHLTLEDYAVVVTQGGAGAAKAVACGGVNP